MAKDSPLDKLPRRTKFSYGIGDLGNIVVNSAIQFFLMKFAVVNRSGRFRED